jgi:predicted nucleotidyltransferase
MIDRTLEGLPDVVQRVLRGVATTAQTALGDSLRALLLFGSGAEKRLRTTSDVNLLFVLARFDRAQVDALRA